MILAGDKTSTKMVSDKADNQRDKKHSMKNGNEGPKKINPKISATSRGKAFPTTATTTHDPPSRESYGGQPSAEPKVTYQKLKLLDLTPRNPAKETSEGVQELIKQVSGFIGKRNPFKERHTVHETSADCTMKSSNDMKNVRNVVQVNQRAKRCGRQRGLNLLTEAVDRNAGENPKVDPRSTSTVYSKDYATKIADIRKRRVYNSREAMETRNEKVQIKASTCSTDIGDTSTRKERADSQEKDRQSQRKVLQVGRKDSGVLNGQETVDFWKYPGQRQCKGRPSEIPLRKDALRPTKLSKPVSLLMRKSLTDVDSMVSIDFYQPKKPISPIEELSLGPEVPNEGGELCEIPEVVVEETECESQEEMKQFEQKNHGDITLNRCSKNPNIPLVSDLSSYDLCDKISKPKELDLDMVKSSSFTVLTSNRYSLYRLESYHQQNVCIKRNGYYEKVPGGHTSKHILPPISSKTSFNSLKSNRSKKNLVDRLSSKGNKPNLKNKAKKNRSDDWVPLPYPNGTVQESWEPEESQPEECDEETPEIMHDEIWTDNQISEVIMPTALRNNTDHIFDVLDDKPETPKSLEAISSEDMIPKLTALQSEILEIDKTETSSSGGSLLRDNASTSGITEAMNIPPAEPTDIELLTSFAEPVVETQPEPEPQPELEPEFEVEPEPESVLIAQSLESAVCDVTEANSGTLTNNSSTTTATTITITTTPPTPPEGEVESIKSMSGSVKSMLSMPSTPPPTPEELSQGSKTVVIRAKDDVEEDKPTKLPSEMKMVDNVKKDEKTNKKFKKPIRLQGLRIKGTPLKFAQCECKASYTSILSESRKVKSPAKTDEGVRGNSEIPETKQSSISCNKSEGRKQPDNRSQTEPETQSGSVSFDSVSREFSPKHLSPFDCMSKSHKSFSSLKKRPKYKSSMLKAIGRKNKIRSDAGDRRPIATTSHFNTALAFKNEINKIKAETKLRSGLTRSLKRDGKISTDKRDMFDDTASLQLSRRNSEPCSFRGFVWKHAAASKCNKASVSSMASSLRHLNTDELEDFIVWETVPPKMTSCWEMSLYHFKRPWSVLSCSVFKDNRKSSTPGLILENLRNGGNVSSRWPLVSESERTTCTKENPFDVEPSIAQKNIDIRNWLAALNFPTPPSTSSDVISEGNFCTEAADGCQTLSKTQASPKRRKIPRVLKFSDEINQRRVIENKVSEKESQKWEYDEVEGLKDLIRRKSGGFVTFEQFLISEIPKRGQNDLLLHSRTIDSKTRLEIAEKLELELNKSGKDETEAGIKEKPTEDASLPSKNNKENDNDEEKPPRSPDAGSWRSWLVTSGGNLRKRLSFYPADINIWKYLFIFTLLVLICFTLSFLDYSTDVIESLKAFSSKYQ